MIRRDVPAAITSGVIDALTVRGFNTGIAGKYFKAAAERSI